MVTRNDQEIERNIFLPSKKPIALHMYNSFAALTSTEEEHDTTYIISGEIERVVETSVDKVVETQVGT